MFSHMPHSTLDKRVGKSKQALYGHAKWLICKGLAAVRKKRQSHKVVHSLPGIGLLYI